MAHDPSGSEHLLQRASQGEREAIEVLLSLHLPGIEAFLRRNAGAFLRGRESASDLAQSVCREVLERLHDGRLRFQGEAEFKQWLYRAAVLKMMNRRRFWQAERRGAGTPLAQPAGSPEASRDAEVLVDHASPSQDVALYEAVERFSRAIDRLPEDHREVLTLARFEGLSHDEIAARKGISAAYSRVLLARALARLGALTSDA